MLINSKAVRAMATATLLYLDFSFYFQLFISLSHYFMSYADEKVVDWGRLEQVGWVQAERSGRQASYLTVAPGFGHLVLLLCPQLSGN